MGLLPIALISGCATASLSTSDAVVADSRATEAESASPSTGTPGVNSRQTKAPDGGADNSAKTPASEVATTVPPASSIPASQAPAFLTVPKAGINKLRIVNYRGVPDDASGTRINDQGLIGAPRGAWGGVAPGQVGNLLLTGHRTSAGSPMLRIPQLRAGDAIYVDQGPHRFVYRAESTHTINFRQASSRALQQAAVPGSPGKVPTRAAIVLSTCATPEDNAQGNYWRDQFGNPTHRIAVYGYLDQVAQRPR